VVISNLVLLEVIDVIRKRVTEKESYTGLTPTAKGQIEAKVKSKIQEFIDKTTKLASQGKALLVDPDLALQDYQKETVNISQPHFGEILDSNICPVCRRSLATRYRYKGLGHYDIQHGINARESGATEIYSFDKAFSQLRTLSEFSTLTVSVP